MPTNCGAIVLCTLVVCLEAVSGCASGFMQLDLLQKRAEKISSGNTVSGNKLDHELRVAPELKFTCSGNITSLLFGGDVRTSVDNRVEYPEVQIWRRGFFFRVFYTKQYSQTIELSSGNFSSDGLLRYNLTTPIPFENENVFGVYHPLQNDSIVRLFYVNEPNAPVSEFINNSNVNLIVPDFTSDISDHHMLIYPVTDPPGCTSDDFLTPEALRQKTLEVNINRVVVRDQQQKVFPDISFTCNGSITKWIVGAGTGGGSSPSSEIQIWRRNGADSYTKVASTQLTAQSPINNSNIYEYIPSSPLGFQEGDILGVYQRENSSVVPYYQESTGPVNLRQSGIVSSAPNSLTAPTLATEYDYPLVTVEIGPPLSSITPVLPTTKIISSSSMTDLVSSTVAETTMITTVQLSSETIQIESSSAVLSSTPVAISTPVATSIPVAISTPVVISTPDAISTMVAVSTPVSISTSLAASSTPFIISTSTPVLFSSASTVSKSLSTATSSLPSTNVQSTTIQVYTSTEDRKSTFIVDSIVSTAPILNKPTTTTTTTTITTTSPPPTLSTSSNITLIVAAIVAVMVVVGIIILTVIVVVVLVKKKQGKPTYDVELEMKKVGKPVNTIANALYSEATEIEVYENLDASFSSDQDDPCFPYEKPVATLSQDVQHDANIDNQKRSFIDPEKHYELDEASYSRITEDNSEPYNTLNRGLSIVEEPVYWKPGMDCVTIYEQFAQRKFREIDRDQVQILENLGSGQFGLVEKGVWHGPMKSVAVALKTLRNDASEEEKVKFLQEAAIMGQFHHPNIVKLHGVVTVGEPAMIVLELVRNGDLRDYLRKLRPIPGEMAPSSLPQQLLGYCRQIASGMEYLSKKGFVHRDLAARNILVDDERTCKIADFGLSRDVSEDDIYVSHGGMIPIRWTAPEALHYKKYSTASDVWSFGVLMYEIWSLGHKPFEDKTNYQVIQLIDNGYRLPPPPSCPRAIYQIMIKCWHPETLGRPSFTSLVSRLSQPENQLLMLTDGDKSVTHSRSTMLGSPLETASDLYSDLQELYSQ